MKNSNDYLKAVDMTLAACGSVQGQEGLLALAQVYALAALAAAIRES